MKMCEQILKRRQLPNTIQILWIVKNQEKVNNSPSYRCAAIKQKKWKTLKTELRRKTKKRATKHVCHNVSYPFRAFYFFSVCCFCLCLVFVYAFVSVFLFWHTAPCVIYTILCFIFFNLNTILLKFFSSFRSRVITVFFFTFSFLSIKRFRKWLLKAYLGR